MRIFRRKQKRLVKMAIKSFDMIYDSCKKVADSMKAEYVPMAYYRTIIHKAKLKKDKNDPAPIHDFVEKYNTVLSRMLVTAVTESEKFKSKVIPLQFIKMQCDFVKDKFKEGYDTHPDNQRPDKKA